MSDMIDRGAAIGALEERRDKYLKDSQTWLQIQLDILAIRALPAAPAEDVRAEALRDAAEWLLSVPQSLPNRQELAAAILALISEAKP